MFIFSLLSFSDEDNDGDDVSPSISQNHKSKVFVEPDTDHIVFTKVSIPKTMRSIYWKYFGFPANDNGKCSVTTFYSYLTLELNIIQMEI